MRYLTVMEVLNFRTLYKVQCLNSGFSYYVRAKYFAGQYKKWDVIRMNTKDNFGRELNEEF